jgi:flagellar biosynthesis/type III secretory pathway chaperone
MPQTSPEINRILECLKKQKDCFVQLLAVSRRQQKAIDEKNDPDLMEALQDKNPLLQTLQELDEEMQPILKNMSDSDRNLVIQKGKALKDEAAQALEQLIAVEDTCAKIIKDKKEYTLDQIKEFQERKKGLKGYGQSGGKSSRFSQEG